MIMQRLRSVLTHRWARALPALLTILLLAPAPVLAFSWVSGWQEIALYSKNVTKGPSWSAKDGANGGTLEVEIGSANNQGEVNSGAAVHLARRLQTNGGLKEAFEVQSAYQLFLQNANVHWKVWLEPVIARRPGEIVNAIKFQKAPVGNTPTVRANRPGHPLTKDLVLLTGTPANEGNYILHVQVTALTKGSSGGSNKTNQYSNADPKSASSHTFTFAGQ